MLLHDARKDARTRHRPRAIWCCSRIESRALGSRADRRGAGAGAAGAAPRWAGPVRAAGGDRRAARPGATAAATDWPQIAALFGELWGAGHGSPVVALNRAVAIAMVDGPAAGLALIEAAGRRARRLPPVARSARGSATPAGPH